MECDRIDAATGQRRSNTGINDDPNACERPWLIARAVVLPGNVEIGHYNDAFHRISMLFVGE
jgi:hypothetical protein